MKKIYLLLIILITALGINAQTVTLNAVLSGKVTSGNVKTDGDLTNISTSGDEGYIKYDLTSLPAGASITSASVKFTAIAPTATSGSVVNKITTTTLDAASPGAGFYAALSAAPAAFTGAWPAAAVPALQTNVLTAAGITDLQNRIAAGQVTYGIIRGSTNVYTFAGYNNGTVANQPQLVINYTIVSPTIVYTPLSSLVCASGNRTLTATITSANGVPTAGIGLPVLYFKINAGAYTAVQGVSIGSNQYTFTFGNTAVAGNVVSYYVVAQDAAGTPNVASNPSAGAAGLAANPPVASTPPTTPNTYTFGNPLGGTVTVGISGTYTTLTAALAQYNAACISSPVVMQLLDATYPSETFPLIINANATATATNNLTIKPALGVTSLITGSNAVAVLKINGADFVNINGSNNGTSTRDLTIENTNVAGTGVVWIASTATDGATNNSIINTNIKGNSGTTTTVGVAIGGNAFGSASDVSNNNLILSNNLITRAQNGIFASGNATTPDQNWNINNNTVGSSVVADKMGFRGILVQNAASFTIASNTVLGISFAGTSTGSGILIGGTLSGGSVSKNKISDIKSTNVGGYGANGILVNVSATSSNVVVSNNFIFDVAANGFAGGTVNDNGYGIFVNSGIGLSFYYNTVNMNTNQAVAGLPAAFNVGVGVTAAGAIDLRDNIFVNTQTTTGERFAIYSEAPNTVFSNINYNDYATAGANLGFIGSNRAALSDIQTGFGSNTNSVNIMPVFNSATDLHINPLNAANAPLDNIGTPVSITTDIDNQTRSATPDMGGDEFTQGVVVAVTTEYFRGSKVAGANYLDWKVTTTDPSVRLILERSADGRSFKSIQDQTATAARCAQGFNYTDAAPLAGINYYRLKTISPDGAFKYSVIVALLNKEKGFELISVAPNPVKDNAILSLISVKSGKMNVSVSDITGKVIMTQSLNVIAGNNPINMNFATLGAGTYNIKVTNADNEIRSVRFVKY